MKLPHFAFKLIGLSLLSIHLQASPISNHPLPTWIQPVRNQTAISIDEKDVTDGYHYVLYDEQVNIATKQDYNHITIQIVNDIGVQNSSEIELTYNPSYQKLFIHYIKVIRNGVTINKLEPKDIKNIQQEKDLNNRIYDGRQTAYISLKDIRKGDLLDYAYTIDGTNPILGQKYTTYFSTEFSIPIANVHYVVVTPSQRKPIFKQHLTKHEVVSRTIGSSTIYEWNFSHPKGKTVEDGVPDWFTSFGFIELTEYNSWKEVVDWALELYKFDNQTSPELESKIKVLNKGTNEEKILNAVHFVQDEIRYMGFEVGENSHRPNSPNRVFRQRFGDCKDKANLLCYILSRMGIEVYPNLVNTNKTKAIADRLPSPNIFNHVTVCIILNGQKHWIDPTDSYQGGLLNAIQYPDYKKTLLVKKGEETVTDIQSERIRKTEVHETFVVADTVQPITLRVITNYYGVEADRNRYQFSANSLTEIEEDYTNYYKSVYGDVRLETRIETSDDRDKNIFKVFEEYSIKGMWQIQDSTSGLKYIQVTPQSMFSLISSEEIKQRKSPYNLAFPLNYTQTIEVKFPKAVSIQTESGTKSDEHFKYSFDFKTEGQNSIVMLTYHYENLTDVVEPEKATDFFNKIDALKEINAFNIPWEQAEEKAAGTIAIGDINWLMVFIAITLALALGVLSFFLYRYDSEPKHAITYAQKMGGWLVLIGIGLCLTCVVQLYHLLSQGYFNYTGWIELTTPGKTNYHPLWSIFLILEMNFKIGFIIFSIFLFFLYVNRRSSFPLFYIIFMGCSLLFSVLEIIISYTMPLMDDSSKTEAITLLVRSIITAAIWIPYMLMSDRVRETFVFTFNPNKQLHEQTEQSTTPENDAE